MALCFQLSSISGEISSAAARTLHRRFYQSDQRTGRQVLFADLHQVNAGADRFQHPGQQRRRFERVAIGDIAQSHSVML